jgi:hypothetical protein
MTHGLSCCVTTLGLSCPLKKAVRLIMASCRFAGVSGPFASPPGSLFMSGGCLRRSTLVTLRLAFLTICSSPRRNALLLGGSVLMAARAARWLVLQTGVRGSPRPDPVSASAAQPAVPPVSVPQSAAPCLDSVSLRRLRQSRVMALLSHPASSSSPSFVLAQVLGQPGRRRIVGKRSPASRPALAPRVKQALPPKRGAQLPAPLLPGTPG